MNLFCCSLNKARCHIIFPEQTKLKKYDLDVQSLNNFNFRINWESWKSPGHADQSPPRDRFYGKWKQRTCSILSSSLFSSDHTVRRVEEGGKPNIVCPVREDVLSFRIQIVILSWMHSNDYDWHNRGKWPWTICWWDRSRFSNLTRISWIYIVLFVCFFECTDY